MKVGTNVKEDVKRIEAVRERVEMTSLFALM